MTETKRARLVVLASGNGSNLQAVIDACAESRLDAVVAGVVSDKPEAYALTRAHEAGVTHVAVPKRKEESRGDYDRALADVVASFDPDWVLLLGWMRVLSPGFLDRFPGRVVNLHPALPGAYPGTHAIERAFEDWKSGGKPESGVMTHLVPDSGVDDGPVLGTRTVPILPGDTLEAFEERVHEAERALVFETLGRLISESATNH